MRHRITSVLMPTIAGIIIIEQIPEATEENDRRQDKQKHFKSDIVISHTYLTEYN
ncbi:hypothetical protein MNV_160012 [Candidatus Methanoperedens nitroreducens]|uniref:Uncharacterized protein n=1 Tax=Candidatus Methanoperedens nitratireducens TaxID=1392998 RepID=A0A284VLG8_9EURY|nr:hypothetical protein MNV_160012 [Candidatus Methanoperedens nitroreducens]